MRAAGPMCWKLCQFEIKLIYTVAAGVSHK